jgi:hypothetical protein
VRIYLARRAATFRRLVDEHRLDELGVTLSLSSASRSGLIGDVVGFRRPFPS